MLLEAPDKQALGMALSVDLSGAPYMAEENGRVAALCRTLNRSRTGEHGRHSTDNTCMLRCFTGHHKQFAVPQFKQFQV